MQVNRWRKSTLSDMNGNCVEVKLLPERRVGVRDSKHIKGPVLTLAPTQWQAFLRSVKNGSFDV